MGKAGPKEHPRPVANIFSRLFFWWTWTLLARGRRSSPLRPEHLHRCPEDDRAARLGDRLERAWEAELRRKRPSLLRALVRLFWKRLLFSGFLQALYTIGVTLTIPPLVFRMVGAFEAQGALRGAEAEAAAAAAAAAVAAAGAAACAFLQAFLLPHGLQQGQVAGVRARAACNALLYRKALRLGAGALRPGAAAPLQALLAADAPRLPALAQRAHFLWMAPVHAVCAAVMLHHQAGWPGVAGAVTMLLVTVPLQTWTGACAAKLGLRAAPLADERLRLLSEVLANIRTIKMAAWEDTFEASLLQARRAEERAQAPARVMRVLHLCLLLFSIHVAHTAFFVVALLVDMQVQVPQIIVTMLHMYFLNIGLNLYMPLAAAAASSGLVAVRRMQEFLLLEERAEQPAAGAAPSRSGSLARAERRPSAPPLLPGAVLLRDAEVRWSRCAPAVLRAVRLRLAPGQLCAVVGPVGAGKTALLLALARELSAGAAPGRGLDAAGLALGAAPGAEALAAGERAALAAQGAWAWGDASVRDNVLLGRPLRPRRYARVLYACCLRRDLRQLPRGDDSPVGERGAGLSGGQRARLSLARAVYEEADVYLLDDPLAAVDARVARRLFERCVLGLLRGATRLLVTHHAHFAARADLVVTVDEGTVSVEEGARWRDAHAALSEEEGDDAAPAAERQGDGGRAEGEGEGEAEEEEEEEQETDDEQPPTTLRRRAPEPEGPTAEKSTQTEPTAEERAAERAAAEAAAAAEEAAEAAAGALAAAPGALALVWRFARAGRCPWLLAAALLLFVLGQAFRSLVDYWVGHWRDAEALVAAALGAEARADAVRAAHLGALVGAVAALAALSFGRVAALSAVCSRAARRLHDDALRAALRAPMRFYEQRPQGELVGPFAADVALVDDGLPLGLNWVMQIVFVIIGLFAVVIASQWYTVVTTLLFVVACFVSLTKLSRVPKKYKLLEALCMQPLLSHVSETYEGLTTIRSLGRQRMFQDIFEARQDVATTAGIAFDSTTATLYFINNVLVACLVSANLLIFFLADYEYDAAALGLVFFLSLSVSFILPMLVENVVELFGSVGAVARLEQMQAVPQEEEGDDEQDEEAAEAARLPAGWPAPGDVEFRDVQLRYGAAGGGGGALALRGLSFRVRGGHKVGVVGRTGAGKSSLLAALLRLAPLSAGQVRVGGVDCARLRLRTLRRAVAVVPQEPALFSGPLRRSLDPEGSLPDAALWGALDAVGLRALAPPPAGLDAPLGGGGGGAGGAGGAQPSAGQRQLLCVARALLRRCRVLVLDEATASADARADRLLQEALCAQFAACTVLTIAHRLRTVAHCDRVLVLNQGRVAELGHPHELLQDPDGAFARMVREAGAHTEQAVRRDACESWRRQEGRRSSTTTTDSADAQVHDTPSAS